MGAARITAADEEYARTHRNSCIDDVSVNHFETTCNAHHSILLLGPWAKLDSTLLFQRVLNTVRVQCTMCGRPRYNKRRLKVPGPKDNKPKKSVYMLSLHVHQA